MSKEKSINTKEDAWVEWVSSFLDLFEVMFYEVAHHNIPSTTIANNLLTEAGAKLKQITDLREKRNKIMHAMRVFDTELERYPKLDIRSPKLQSMSANSLDGIRRNIRIYRSQCDSIIDNHLCELGKEYYKEDVVAGSDRNARWVDTMIEEFRRVTQNLQTEGEV